ncbi:MAG: helix-turn-helix domain-containing protein [Phycisphaerales bacterium]|jgi:hypothetical protein
MEKMFYSIEEAAQKLNKSVEDVRQMASRGQLQEFRDRDKLMFKREQVDLLAGGDDGAIPLASDSGELSLSGSGSGMKLDPMGSGMGMKDEKDSTGISIFEAEGTDDADANAVTRVSSAPTMQDPGKSGSGSGGLLDLTKEADDTSLGAGLMEDVYGADTIAQQTAAETAIGGGDGGALFESPSGGADFESPAAAGAMMMAAAPEAYDGGWSGIAGGAALGGALVCLVGVFAVIIGFTSTTGGGLMNTLGNNFAAIIGGAAALTAVFAGVGFVLGKKS